MQRAMLVSPVAVVMGIVVIDVAGLSHAADGACGKMKSSAHRLRMSCNGGSASNTSNSSGGFRCPFCLIGVIPGSTKALLSNRHYHASISPQLLHW